MTRSSIALRFLPRSWQTLTRRVPLLLAVLCGATAGSISWIAYRRLHDAVIGGAFARLNASGLQVVAQLEPAVRRLQRDPARVATADEFIAVLRGDDSPPSRDRAVRKLQAERSRSAQILATALWTTGGRLVASDGDSTRARQNTPFSVGSDPGQPELALIGPLRARDDTITMATRGVVHDGVDTVGFYVTTSRIGGEPTLLNRLIGPGASVLLGNAAGDLWTNFSRATAGPPTDSPERGGGGRTLEFRDSAGTARLGSVRAVPGTPWLVAVDLPKSVALGPANRFLFDMLAIAALFVAVAGGVAWIVVRRSLRPLAEVTHAAEDLAQGDYTRRVSETGYDELARLGASFNAMAGEVDRARVDAAARATALEVRNRELGESEARYRQLVDQSPDCVLVHRDMNIILANPSTARLLRIDDPTSLVGRRVLDLVDPADIEKATESIRKALEEDGATSLMELKIVRSDGTQATVESTGIRLLVDGEPAVQSILRDVTERKELEEQFRQSQKMDAVGRLAGGVAHDFNNLLTVIQAYSEFALMGSAPDDPRRADIEEVRKAANSAAKLTRQLLAFSRKQVLAPTVIDLNESITGTLGMIDRLIGVDIEVVTALGTDLGLVWADRGQLEQVLVNLAVNARDAMPDGGLLRIETANTQLRTDGVGASGAVIPAGEYVTLSVQDSGVGMSAEVQQRIFEPFFTTKQVGRGTGLGLATVYGIVQQSGGYIRVRSAPERGATFVIYFPRHKREGIEAVRVGSGEYRALETEPRILLVDDDRAVRTALRRTLMSAKFVVTEADSAAQAIQLVRAGERPNLLITDMVMPGLSGAELVGELEALLPGLPSIIISGYAHGPASREWNLPARSVFVEKPVAPADLIRRVRQVLAASAAAPSA